MGDGWPERGPCGPRALARAVQKGGERGHGRLGADVDPRQGPEGPTPREPGSLGRGLSRCRHTCHVLKAVPVLQLVPQKAGDGALLSLGQGPHLQTLVPQGHAKEDPKICGPHPTETYEHPTSLPRYLGVPSGAHVAPFSHHGGAQSPKEALPSPRMFAPGSRLRQQGQASTSSPAGAPLPPASRAPSSHTLRLVSGLLPTPVPWGRYNLLSRATSAPTPFRTRVSS